MSDNKSAVKAGLGYTFGNILVNGINFLTIPLFSRLLTTEEFGVFNLYLSYDAILFVLIGLGIHTSIKSAHYEFKKTDEYVSSVTIIILINALAFVLLFLIGGNYLSNLMGLNKTALLLLVPHSLGVAVFQLYNQRLSLDYEYKKYLVVTFLNSIGNIIISLLLILTLYRSEKDIGRILGSVITIFSIAAVLLYKMYSLALPKFIPAFWKFSILYSLPIVPHGISQVLLGNCDRIMISNMINNSAAAIYSLAGNLKLVLTVIITSISFSWGTFFFSKMESKNIEEIRAGSAVLLRLFFVLSIGLMAISPELIYFFGGSKYAQSTYVAIPVIIDSFILFLYNIIVQSEYYMKKTKYIMLGTLVAAIINVVLNYIFIKSYGMIAAAYTTLFSYVCYFLLHFFISKQLVHFNVIAPTKIIIALFVLSVFGAADLLLIKAIVPRYALSLVLIAFLSPPLLVHINQFMKREA